MIDKRKLAFIDDNYMNELRKDTKSNEFMKKAGRPYLGLFDSATNWFVPFRSHINPKRPSFTYWTVSRSQNSARKPGLDFQKAIYIKDPNKLKEISWKPKEWDDVQNEFGAINQAFCDYVLWVDGLDNSERYKKWSTVPFFPEGIKNIRERVIAEEIEIEQSISNDLNF